MNLFKLRASAAGKLATNPKLKSEALSETSKTYIKEWLTERIYGVQKQIKSKYIEKGIEMEDQAIDFTIRVLNLPFAMKNEKYFEDEFFCGTPDMILEDCIIDIKNSWDCFTFPLFEKEIPNSDYYYQLQVYMHLTGRKNAKLCYILLDTPATQYESGILYDVGDQLRIKTFNIEYNPEVIELLKSRVIAAREYVTTLF